MRVVSSAMVRRIGTRARRRFRGICQAALRANVGVELAGNRTPNVLMLPRTWLISWVRESTIAERDRRIARSARVAMPRCTIGDSSFGSMRAKRASCSASTRSHFLSLS